MVTTVRPKDSETPSSPIPTPGKAAAITALPQPAKVSQNVPIASAASLRVSMMYAPGLIPGAEDSRSTGGGNGRPDQNLSALGKVKALRIGGAAAGHRSAGRDDRH